MNITLEESLERLSNVDEPLAYLAAQDSAADLARREYARLLGIAREHESSEMRFEAVQLIALVCGASHRDDLSVIRDRDPDPRIRDLAEALLFRSIVAENIRASRKFDETAFKAYEREVREQAAHELFRRNA